MMTLRYTENAWIVELDGKVLAVVQTEEEARAVVEQASQGGAWTPSWRYGAPRSPALS